MVFCVDCNSRFCIILPINHKTTKTITAMPKNKISTIALFHPGVVGPQGGCISASYFSTLPRTLSTILTISLFP